MGLAARWGSRTAVVSPQLTLSYSELVARAARSARELQLHGIAAGDRVAVALADSGEAVVIMIALWMLGATAVPYRLPV